MPMIGPTVHLQVSDRQVLRSDGPFNRFSERSWPRIPTVTVGVAAGGGGRTPRVPSLSGRVTARPAGGSHGHGVRAAPRRRSLRSRPRTVT
eukprot:1072-Hanusia_phi.AAC.2